MKEIIITFLVTCFVLLAGCSSKKYTLPADTDLEFWITENVEKVDFSDYEEIYGLWGGQQYLGKGYHTVIDEQGVLVQPEHYVLYTITSYPDYSDEGCFVTQIDVTDPNVKIHGLNVSSSLEDFDHLFKSMGYKDIQDKGYYHIAKKGKISYSYGEGKMTISVEVTNKEGILF